MVDREKVLNLVGRVFEPVPVLLSEATRLLFEGGPPDRASWLSAAESYETLLVELGDGYLELPAGLTAVGELARLMIALDLKDVCQIAVRIPEVKDQKQLDSVVKALVSYRKTEFPGEHQASEAANLANEMYSLIGSYARDREMVPLALGQVVRQYGQALQLYQQSGRLHQALRAACGFIANANSLATQFDDPEFLNAALRYGEEVADADGMRSSASQPLAVAALSSNLLTTCRLLSERNPAQAGEHIRKGLAFAGRLREAIYLARDHCDQPEILALLDQRYHQYQVTFHLALAKAEPGEFEPAAAAAWAALDRFSMFAEESGDPDVKLRSALLRRQLSDQLRELQVTFHLALAKAEPGEFEPAAAAAWAALDRFSMFAEESGDPDVKLRSALLRRQLSDQLRELQVTFHLALAKAEPGEFEPAAAAAWAALDRFSMFAEESGDPDVKLRSALLRRQLSDQLRELHPGWVPPVPDVVPGPPERAGFNGNDDHDGTMADSLEQMLNEANALSSRVDATGDRQALIDLLTEAFTLWFARLRQDLGTVLGEVGLNLQTCRLLTGLGAVTGGHLGVITSGALRQWLMHLDDPMGTPAGWRQQRQQMIPVRNRDSQMRAYGSILGLGSVVGKVVGTRPEVAVEAASVLRRLFTSLISGLLYNPALVETIKGRHQDRLTDLVNVPLTVPKPLTSVSFEAYLGRYEGEPAGARDLGSFRFVRSFSVRREDHSERAEGSQRPGQTVQATDEEKEQGGRGSRGEEALSDIPSLELEPEIQARLTKGTCTPNDLVGRTCTIDGVTHELTQILGEGEKKVVYEMTSQETGQTKALGLFRSMFDRASSLREQLSNEVRKGPERNEDLVIQLCEELIQLNDQEEVAYFNKGVMLMAKKQFEEAAACFDHAVVLKPNDIVNWIHMALALAKADKNIDAANYFCRAVRIDALGVKSYLEQIEEQGKDLHAILEKAIAVAPDRQDLREVAGGMFGKTRGTPSESSNSYGIPMDPYGSQGGEGDRRTPRQGD